MGNKSFWRGPGGLSVLGLAGFAVYWLLTGHRQHLLELLPLLLLLACPLMHLLGHGRHHGHHSAARGESADEAYRRGLEEGRKAQAADAQKRAGRS